MTQGERRRVAFLFGALGCVPVFLVGWLGWLQVLQAGELRRTGQAPLLLGRRTADVQRDRRDQLPSPRGTIRDRHGATLAIDCAAFEVRAEVRPPRKARQDCGELRLYLANLVERLCEALTRDPSLADRAVAWRDYQKRLQARIADEWDLATLPATGEMPKDRKVTGEVLVDAEVDVLPVVEALYDLDDGMDSLHLHFLHTHVRSYPERDLTYGLVGYLEDQPVRDPRTDKLLGYQSFAPIGLEAMAALVPGAPGARVYRVDSKSQRFFSGYGDQPAPASLIETALDLELQKVATHELEAGALSAGKDGKQLPQWGALVLVEVATGDVLAASSWQRDVKSPKGAACAPYQLTYEPGSIVKPLLFAYALQYGGLDWNREYNCSSTGADHHAVVEETGRLVRDDHGVGTLTPHGIIVNSSNIGAVKVGSLLTREQWRGYLDVYGVGRSLGLNLPHEQTGGVPKKSWDPAIAAASFKRWSGSSYSIGYELRVNAMQMARAYLTMISGRQRELRLVRSVEVDGVRQEVPVGGKSERFLDPAVVDAVTAAMIDVVSDEPHSTGKVLVESFRKQGIELHGLVAGKTGTAASHSFVKGKGTVEVRNASFVAFAPASAPRYLVVCVLQKDDSAHFYGGSYAAPVAARVLLEAMRLEERRRLCQGPQVSASPGSTGRGRGAPETSQAGR